MGAEESFSARCDRSIALLLAGGAGTRLQPLTSRRPKPLMPFGGGMRLVDITLENCARSGLRRVALLTQGRSEPLRAHVASAWKGRIQALAEAGADTDEPNRGTADAVARALRIVEKSDAQHIFILATDHVYRMDYRRMMRFHLESDAGATVGCVEMPLSRATPFGVLEVEGAARKVLRFEEKPKGLNPIKASGTALVSMGIYLFSRDMLVDAILENSVVCDSHDLGGDVMPALARSGLLHAFDYRDERDGAPRYWRDAGTVDSYYGASMDLVSAPPRFALRASNGGPLASIDPSARVQRCVLFPGVHVGPGAEVTDSILLEGSSIGSGATVRRAIVEEGIAVPDALHVGFDPAADATRFAVSPGGIVVIEKSVSPDARTADKPSAKTARPYAIELAIHG